MKVKFNWMDALILLVLIAAVAAGGYFLSHRSRQSSMIEDKTVDIMVELTSKEEDFARRPQVGDVVVIGEKEKMETVVTKVEVNPAKTISYDTLNGKITEGEVPNRFDILLTLRGSGTESGQTVEINGNAVRVGMGATVKNKNWAGYGFILAVDTTGK